MTARIAIVTGSGALLVAAAVHVAQLFSIFHAVPWIGPLFAADAVASAAVAIVLLTTRSRVAAAAGALVSAGALAGLALSSTTGLFGWHETTLRPSVVIAIGAELVALAMLVPVVVAAPPPGRRSIRTPVGAGLVAIAALHLAAAPPEWDDARAVFWLFVALAAACLVFAVRVGQGLDRWAWRPLLVLTVVPLAGFVMSRATGLPGDSGDIGDWANPLGLATLAVEAPLALLAAWMAAGTTAWPRVYSSTDATGARGVGDGPRGVRRHVRPSVGHPGDPDRLRADLR